MVDVIKGRYQIVREIARSNDIVFEARDSVLGRRIALKELNIAPGLTGQARRERIERFNREARAAGKLSHPNIVSIYEFGEENGRHFIAMEFLEGQTLRDVMAVRGALPLKEAVDIACQILDALAHAHAHKVIHRDIKPDNIFLSPGNAVKLADFGIARLSEEPALTSNGQVFGTPSYMSPEQIEGKSIDHRSDLFSVGVLLYEMLAGRKPFTGDSVISITYAVMNADPPSLHGVPSGIEAVIRRALSKNPNGRQANAEQMKLDLRMAERTPDALLSSPSYGRTGMGMPGMGGPLPLPGSSLPPVFPQNNGYGANGTPGYGSSPGNYGASVPPPLPMPLPTPAPMPAGNGNLPWNFNTPGLPSLPQAGRKGKGKAASPVPAGIPGYVQGAGMGPSAGGVTPYGPQAFPIRPAEPLLSPGAKSFLLAVLAAIVLGGGIAGGVIAVMNSYSRYKVDTASKRIAALMDKGADEYNKADYTNAIQDYEAALAGGPAASQRDKINTNLAYAYVQFARTAEQKQDWKAARDAFAKAVQAKPDYELAASELKRYDSANGSGGASSVAPVSPAGSASAPPPALDTHNIPVPTDTAPTGPSQQDFLADRRAAAQQLITEGQQLASQGDMDGARDKWREAIAKAPATPERDAAQALLDKNQPPPEAGF